MLRPLLAPTLAAVLLTIACPCLAPAQDGPKPLRAGIIGLDTTHVVAFTKLLNADEPRAELAGVRIVAAYPGGSPDVATSRNRVEGFTAQLRDQFGIEIVDSIESLLTKVDVVFLESVDGRPHLEQARPVLEAGKPLFIDKPVAGSLADAVAIFAIAERTKTPCFSSSSLRYSPGIVGLKDNANLGEVRGCATFGPCTLEEHHPDLFWYGIHGVEALFTVMGTGCASVARTQTEGTELVVGTWSDGRVGTFRGLRDGKGGYGALAFGTKGIVLGDGSGSYDTLLVEVCNFFRTGRPPVGPAETLEIFAFMEAADESKRQGGMPVTIESVMEQARAKASTGGRD